MQTNNSTQFKVIAFSAAARDAHTTPSTIKRYVRDGILDGVKLPGHVRMSGVTQESLDKLIQSSVVKSGVEQ